WRNAIQRLPANLDALSHFCDTHQISRIHVALGADRHVEFVGIVAKIRKDFSYVVVDAGGAGNWTEQRQRDRIFARDLAHALRSFEVNLISRQQILVVAELRDEAVEKRADRFVKATRQ